LIAAGIQGLPKKKLRDPDSPVRFPAMNPSIPFFLNRPDIFQVRIPIDRFEEVQPFTSLCVAAFPATRDCFFLAALPDCTKSRGQTPSRHPFLHLNFTIAPGSS